MFIMKLGSLLGFRHQGGFDSSTDDDDDDDGDGDDTKTRTTRVKCPFCSKCFEVNNKTECPEPNARVASKASYINKSNSKLNVSFDELIADARDFTSQNEYKVKENDPSRIRAPCDSSAILMNNGEDSRTEKKGFVPNVQTAVSTASNTVFNPPPKKGAFRMSVLEDYLELDDDDNSKVETFSTEKSVVATATVTLEKPPAFSALSDESMLAENGANSTGTSASSYSKMVSTQPSFTNDKVAPPEESNAGPSMFNFGGKVTSMKDSDAASPVFNFVSKSVDEVAQPQFAFASSAAVGESVDVKSGSFSVPKPESSSSVSAVVAAATNSVASSAPSQPASGNPNSAFPFGSSDNNDKMNFVDIMAEDTNQASTPTVPVFGQQPVSTPQSGSVFGSTPAVAAANPIQFSIQQNPTNPQNPSPFQASGGASQGGSFLLGTGGYKSNRRIVKVKHNRQRKK